MSDKTENGRSNGEHMPKSQEGLMNGTASAAPIRKHTFVAFVEDIPGVLNRVASLFRRRGYNIDSLTVGHTETTGVSRMTIVVEGDDTTARLFEANLYKLVNVLRVQDVTDVPRVIRNLALIKVKATPETRTQILQMCEVFRARVVDVAPDALVVEITGSEDKAESLLEVLKPFGIIEMVQTGLVAMTRGAEAISVEPRFTSSRIRMA